MKPTHRVFCPDAGRKKLRFETEKKGLNFIKFNGDEIERTGGKRPVRAYYCVICGCWHVTSRKKYINPDASTRTVVSAYERSLEYEKKIRRRTS